MVRNRTPAEVEANTEPHDRDQREESFFEKLPWNTLPKSRRGVQALKKYLADLLCTRIQMGFPSMLETIQSRRFLAASQLEALGQTRESIEQKRAYLSKIAQNFHSQALAALHGRYGAIKEDNMKLRKAIRDANDVFMQDIKNNGHLVPFSELPSLSRTTIEANGLPGNTHAPNAAAFGSNTQNIEKEASENLEESGASSSSESEREMRPPKVCPQTRPCCE